MQNVWLLYKNMTDGMDSHGLKYICVEGKEEQVPDDALKTQALFKPDLYSLHFMVV